MNFDLTDEQRTFRDVVREFADEVVRPGAAERDERAEFPLEVVRRMADLGLFGLPFPKSTEGPEPTRSRCASRSKSSVASISR